MEHVSPRHVWVDVTSQWGEYAQPGILVARRVVNDRGRPKWQGWVIYASRTAAAHEGNAFVYQSWVDAAHIRLVDVDRPAADLTRIRPVGHRA